MREVSTSFLSDKNYELLINELNNTNTDYIHFDVMDGKFVDNTNLLSDELCKYLDLCKKKKDVHLMVENPLEYIEKTKDKNIDFITIHYEIDNFLEVVKVLKDYNIKVGVAIKPDTLVSDIKEILPIVDLVLVMSVYPGYSGQKFILSSIDKIKKLFILKDINNYSYKISVDGGVNSENIHLLNDADIVVSSSFVLNDYDNINIIKNM